MSRHTPGPWKVDEHNDVGAEGRHVATLSLYGDGSDDANAHLIAAAPDLLEALRTAEAALADIGDADREPGDDVEWCERRAAEALPLVRAAIAKARGSQ